MKENQGSNSDLIFTHPDHSKTTRTVSTKGRGREKRRRRRRRPFLLDRLLQEAYNCDSYLEI